MLTGDWFAWTVVFPFLNVLNRHLKNAQIVLYCKYCTAKITDAINIDLRPSVEHCRATDHQSVAYWGLAILVVMYKDCFSLSNQS